MAEVMKAFRAQVATHCNAKQGLRLGASGKSVFPSSSKSLGVSDACKGAWCGRLYRLSSPAQHPYGLSKTR